MAEAVKRPHARNCAERFRIVIKTIYGEPHLAMKLSQPVILMFRTAGTQKPGQITGFDFFPRDDDQRRVLRFDFARRIAVQLEVGFAGRDGKFSFTDK